jgi:hypothetical protein
MSKWLNAKPAIDVAIARKICDYIGADIIDVTNSANRRLLDELGPWPPITVDPSVLTEDEIMERVNAKIDAGAVGLAALHDPDKGKSKGVDPEFA